MFQAFWDNIASDYIAPTCKEWLSSDLYQTIGTYLYPKVLEQALAHALAQARLQAQAAELARLQELLGFCIDAPAWAMGLCQEFKHLADNENVVLAAAGALALTVGSVTWYLSNRAPAVVETAKPQTLVAPSAGAEPNKVKINADVKKSLEKQQLALVPPTVATNKPDAVTVVLLPIQPVIRAVLNARADLKQEKTRYLSPIPQQKQEALNDIYKRVKWFLPSKDCNQGQVFIQEENGVQYVLDGHYNKIPDHSDNDITELKNEFLTVPKLMKKFRDMKLDIYLHKFDAPQQLSKQACK